MATSPQPSPEKSSANSTNDAATAATAASAAVAPLLSSPPSLASFSFSQFLNGHDDAPACDAHAFQTASSRDDLLLGAEADKSDTAAAAVAASPPLPPHAPTFSFDDCVRFKLCLTCALCGRLLRHQPAAIETCGHCFCYDCINSAVEDGCAPLTQQWPWSRLDGEVCAAAARWCAAATSSLSVAAVKAEAASTADEEVAEKVRDTTSSTRLASPQRADDADADVVVTAITPTRRTPPVNSHGAGVSPQRPTRKPRKVRQKCPLCLGPAFKWMLVSVPPVAELCNQLNRCYPALEDTLRQLAENAPIPPETPTAGPTSSAAEEGHQTHDVDAAPAPTDSTTAVELQLAAAAFTPQSPSQSLQKDRRPKHSHHHQHREDGTNASANSSTASSSPSEKDEEDEEDEEAVRRRRRSSGGPRKEITFADEVLASPAKPHRSSAEHSPPLQPPPMDLYTLSALVSDRHDEHLHDYPGAPLARGAGPLFGISNGADGSSPSTLTPNTENGSSTTTTTSSSTLADFSGTSSATTAAMAAASMQLSADLIPSPSVSVGVPAPDVTALARERTWSDEVACNGGGNGENNPTLPSSGILGQSPSVDHRHEDGDARLAADDLIEAGIGQLQHECIDPVHAITVAEPVAASQVPYLAETMDGEDELLDDVPSFNDRCSGETATNALGAREAELATGSRERGCVLLDTASLSPQTLSRCVSLLQGDDGARVKDTKLESVAPSYTLLTDTANTATHTPYSSVRGGSRDLFKGALRTSDPLGMAKETKWDAEDLTAHTRAPAAADAMVSVHPHDVWTLDAAHLRRHLQLPSCYVVVRVGHLVWGSDAENAGTTTTTTPTQLTKVNSLAFCVTEKREEKRGEPEGERRASGLNREVSLSLAACTAAVLGVPCIQAEEFFSLMANKEGMIFQAATFTELDATAEGEKAPLVLPEKAEKIRRGLWMASTRKVLLQQAPLLPSWTKPSDTVQHAPRRAKSQHASFFFTMPDGAVQHLMDCIVDRWIQPSEHTACAGVASDDSEICMSGKEVKGGEVAIASDAEPPIVSRKRTRDVEAQTPAWDTTDNCPQRAWRRLVLAAGAAAVEVSASLFSAAAAAALEKGELVDNAMEGVEANPQETDAISAGDDNNSDAADVARMARLLAVSPRNAATDNWIHVDVSDDDDSLATALAVTASVEERQAENSDALPAAHALFVLYSPAVARKASERAANYVRSSVFVLNSTNAQELTQRYQRRLLSSFRLVVKRIAAVLAAVLTPVLPEGQRVECVRPADWLLELITKGICDDGSCTATERAKRHRCEKEEVSQCGATLRDNQYQDLHGSLVQQDASEVHSVLPAHQPTQTSVAAEGAFYATLIEASQSVPQRIGVYRSLLYADTP